MFILSEVSLILSTLHILDIIALLCRQITRSLETKAELML